MISPGHILSYLVVRMLRLCPCQVDVADALYPVPVPSRFYALLVMYYTSTRCSTNCIVRLFITLLSFSAVKPKPKAMRNTPN